MSSKSFLKKWGAFFDYRKPSKNSTMDILVVRSRKGELRSSSFHVDFKWKTIKPSSKEVDIIVNGNVVDLKMKISRKGRAYFEVPDLGESTEINWSTDCNQSEDDLLLMSANNDFASKQEEEEKTKADNQPR